MIQEKIHVLYVDDESALLELGKMFLELSEEFIVTTVTSAPEAIRILELERFDAIVSDYQMPGMDGIGFLKAVRTRGDAIPFIIFTGRGREEVVIEALNAGADFYLQKGGEPISQFAELAHKIKKAVDGRWADEALTESEERFRSLFENALEMIQMVRPDGSFLHVNPAWKKTLGYSDDDIGTLSFFDIIHPDSLEHYLLLFRELLSGTEAPHIETQFLTKDKKTISVVGNCSPEYKDGMVVSVRGIFHDITGRKKADAQILAIESRYRMLLQNLNDAVIVSELTGHGPGRIVDLNDQLCRMLGYTRDELLRMTPIDFTVPAAKDLMPTVAEEMKTKGQVIFVTEHVTKGGNRIPVEISTKRYLHEGKPVLLSTIRDITQRKQVEVAMQKNEGRFRALIENASDIIRILDREGRIVFDTAASERLLGYPAGYTIGRKAFEFIHPDDLAMVQHEFLQVHAKTNTGVPTEFRIRKADGSYIWVESIAKNLLDVPGIDGIVITTRDIEERKNTGAAFQTMVRSMVGTTGQDALRKIAENVGLWLGAECVMVGEIQPDRQMVKVLSMILDGKDVTGFSYPLKGTPCDNVTEKGFCLYPDHVIDLFPESKDIVQLNIRGYMGTPLRNSAGQVIGILCALCRNPIKTPPALQEIMNIIAVKAAAEIERTRMTAALRESEERFHAIFENANDAVTLLELTSDGLPSRFIDVNENTCRMTGYTRDEMLTLSPKDLDDPEEWTDAGEIVQKIMEQGSQIFERTIVRKDGKKISVEISVQIFILNHKKLQLSIIRDITERKQVEEALWESRQKLSDAMDLADLVNWEFDVASGIFTFNDRFYAMYGTTAEREGGYLMPAEVYAREFVHQDEQFVVVKETQKAITTNDPDYTTQLEHRIIRRDGEVRHIIVRIAITKDAKGRTIKTRGANQDITERKRAEEALHHANKQLNLLSSITRHDILNQLMVLKGYLNLSHKMIDKPEILIDYIARGEKAVDTIGRQITFTRDYQELGAAAPSWQDVNANIKKALTDLAMRDISVEVEQKGKEIFADPLFEKVFYNLIDNALRYGGEGMTTIRVSSKEIDTGLLIVCEDDGAGISAEDKKKLFTRGFGKNTGLGLFLSREILAITGITITENGTPGKEARFEIFVPKGMYRFVRVDEN